jgi:RHS repeat-associated protein
MVTRPHKYAGSVVSLAVDGENYLNTFFIERADLYPNQFITVSSYGQYTKHYFAHDRRVSSRVGGGINYDGQTPADEPWTTDLPSGRGWYDRSEAMKTQLSRAFECTDMTVERLELTTEWGVQQLMEHKEEGEIFYYHQNHQGSPSFISTTSGFLTEHLLLLAYGEVFASNQNAASWQNPYSFTGKEQDMESGLHYFGARYYLADIGMWLSTDPLADKYANVTPYSYCLSNPVNFTDPFGLEPWPIWQRLASWMGLSNRVTIEQAQAGKVKPGQYVIDNNGRRFNYEADKRWYNESNTSDNAQSGWGMDFFDAFITGIGSAGTYFSVNGNFLHNDLYWKGKTTGKIYTKNPFTKNRVGWKANSFKASGKAFQGAKSLGSKFGVAGLLITGYDIVLGDGLTTSNTLDATFGAAGFIPGVGWIISGSYFLINTGVQLYSGKTIGEHLDE